MKTTVTTTTTTAAETTATNLSCYEVHLQSRHMDNGEPKTLDWRVLLNAETAEGAKLLAFKKCGAANVCVTDAEICDDPTPLDPKSSMYEPFEVLVCNEWHIMRPCRKFEVDRDYNPIDVLNWYEVEFENSNTPLSSGTVHNFVSRFVLDGWRYSEKYDEFSETWDGKCFCLGQSADCWDFLYWLNENYLAEMRALLEGHFYEVLFLYKCFA